MEKAIWLTGYRIPIWIYNNPQYYTKYLLQSNLNRSIPVLGSLENMDLVWTPPIILPPSAFPWKAITGKSAVCVCRHRLSSNRWVISFTNFSYIRTPFSAHRECHFSEMRSVLSPKYSSIVPKILEYCTKNTGERKTFATGLSTDHQSKVL